VPPIAGLGEPLSTASSHRLLGELVKRPPVTLDDLSDPLARLAPRLRVLSLGVRALRIATTRLGMLG